MLSPNNNRRKLIKIGEDFESTPQGVRNLSRKKFGSKKRVATLIEKHVVEGRRIPNREGLTYKKEIKDLRDEMASIVESKGVTKEQVVEEISLIAFNHSGLCSSLEVTTRDKLKALDMLSKWLGLYERDNAQKAAQNALLQVAFVGSDALPNEIKETLRRESLLEDSIWGSESMSELEVEVKGKLSGKSK